MAPLLQWELALPGSWQDGVLERVSLDEDGAVERVVLGPGDTERPELGWWEGRLDAASLGGARTLADSPWPSGATLPSPPAAGAWWVSGASGRLPLWSADGDDPAAAVRSQLAAVQAACTDAADTPRCVLRVWAVWAPLDEAWCPMLHVESIGRERVTLWIDDAGGTAAGAFLTDAVEVLGYTGTELWVPPGVHAFAVLRDSEPGPLGLEVTGDVADEAGTRLPFRAVVAVADA